MTNSPVRLTFTGSPTAGLFTRQVAASFEGVLERNMILDPASPMYGFVSASIDGRPWTDTMWTRDAGVFLRELALWGRFEEGAALAERLIDLVRPNEAALGGYCTFPMFFKLGEPGSGSELDGTAAILIGLVLLWERLPEGHTTRLTIERFLTAESSPLVYILNRLEEHPLIPGSGEFGGGCGIDGEYYNAVQNNLVLLALQAAARLFHAFGDEAFAATCEQAAARLSQNMLRLLRAEDGSWIWAISTETLRPEPAIINHIINKGFGGLNGILSMAADVNGLTPFEAGWEGLEAARLTFEKLFAFPRRRAMFEKYGVWTQFDEFCSGYHTGPSYGHGYATQAMFLMDHLEMAGKAVDFLAEVTRCPFPANHLDRDSDDYFYERIYLPELLENPTEMNDWEFKVFDGQKFDQGCGALNLVCVAEPLKIARLIAGVDDADPARLRLIPRLPPAWSGFHLENWPVLTSAGLSFVEIACERQGEGLRLSLSVREGQPLPALAVRLPQGKGWAWQFAGEVSEVTLSV